MKTLDIMSFTSLRLVIRGDCKLRAGTAECQATLNYASICRRSTEGMTALTPGREVRCEKLHPPLAPPATCRRTLLAFEAHRQPLGVKTVDQALDEQRADERVAVVRERAIELRLVGSGSHAAGRIAF